MAKTDVRFINPFIEGTVETLKIQCSVVVTPQKPRLGKDATLPPCDIAGVIGITSVGFKGTIILGFPEQVFLNVMEGMLGERFTKIDADMEDGAAELLNIIFGYGKRKLNADGHDIEKAIPTVIRGKSVSIKVKAGTPSFVVPIVSAAGDFFIQISVEG